VYTGIVPQSYLDRVTAADREARWRHRLLTGERAIGLAFPEGPLAGVVSWSGSELTSLYVGAGHRGGGLGGRLLRYAIGDAPAHLWVFAANPRAIAFYERHGFALDGGELTDPDTGLPELRMSR
jgi:GNAT superfamily N-acetyltransferase